MKFTKTHHEQWKIKQNEEKCPKVVIQFISQCMDKFNLKTFLKINFTIEKAVRRTCTNIRQSIFC